MMLNCSGLAEIHHQENNTGYGEMRLNAQLALEFVLHEWRSSQTGQTRPYDVPECLQETDHSHDVCAGKSWRQRSARPGMPTERPVAVGITAAAVRAPV